jgi:ketosteroid isomerase-like protein
MPAAAGPYCSTPEPNKEIVMKHSRPFRFTLLAAALALAGAAAAKESPLDAKSKQFEELFRKGDTTAAAALYAEDGVVLPPNHARVQGRADIAAFFKGFTDAGFSLKLTPTDSWMDGGLAGHAGTYILMDKDQKEVDHGKWLEFWKKGADGKWWLVRDMWNSDDPPPPPPPAPTASSDKT